MYTYNELKEIERQPKINDISLNTLREYYKYYLYPFIYTYTVKDILGDTKNIELRFDKENFCHLLGVEYIVKNSISYRELHNFKGKDGWDNIKLNLITYSSLKLMNKSRFNSVKDKSVFFYLIPTLISEPRAVLYNRSKVNSDTKIECEVLFYGEYLRVIIHLGIEKHSSEDYYVPRTFAIERITEKNNGRKFVENQQEIIVEKTSRVIMQ